jgi:hypothetical protein
MSLEIEIHFDEAQIAALLNIPLHLRLGPAERVLKAMAKPVVAKAKAIAPSSRKSGTRYKWAQKIKQNAAWQNDSGKHIGYVYRKTERGGYRGYLVIGGMHPQAKKQNFDAGKDRKVMYWGRDAGKTKRIDPKDRFMQKAFDETRSLQISAGNTQLEKELKELNFGKES